VPIYILSLSFMGSGTELSVIDYFTLNKDEGGGVKDS